MGLGGLVLDFPALLHKGLRILRFQLSGVYCKCNGPLLAAVFSRPALLELPGGPKVSDFRNLRSLLGSYG